MTDWPRLLLWPGSLSEELRESGDESRIRRVGSLCSFALDEFLCVWCSSPIDDSGDRLGGGVGVSICVGSERREVSDDRSVAPYRDPECCPVES
jgi:hypothetical protein